MKNTNILLLSIKISEFLLKKKKRRYSGFASSLKREHSDEVTWNRFDFDY